MDREAMQAALAQVVKLMDEGEVSQEDAIALVGRALSLSPEDVKRLAEAYDAM